MDLSQAKIFALVTAAVCLLSAAVDAAEPFATTQTEVAAILSHLGSSQCRFFRNGNWYNGAQARDHLQMKYDQLVKRGLVVRAEDFISGAGTRSSMSGEPYKVQCPNHDPEPSAVWLADELRRVRESKGK